VVLLQRCTYPKELLAWYVSEDKFRCSALQHELCIDYKHLNNGWRALPRNKFPHQMNGGSYRAVNNVYRILGGTNRNRRLLELCTMEIN